MEREAEIRESVQREARRLARAQIIVTGIGLFAVFVVAPALVLWTFNVLPLHIHPSPQVVVGITLVLYFSFQSMVVVAMAGRSWVRHSGRSNLIKRIQRAEATIERLQRLQAEHPELVDLDEVRELLDDEKAQMERRWSFWSGVLVNLFFTLLGFALSYVATKLGWLP